MSGAMQGRLRPVAIALVALVTVAGLGACSSKGKLRQPAELQPISEPRVDVSRVWQTRATPGADGEVSGLQLLVTDELIYTAGVNGEVRALARDTGRQVWRVRHDARFSGGPGLAGDRLLLGSLDGEVLALSREDGSLLWRSRAPSEVLAPPVGNARVVVARSVDGRVIAFNAADGERLWTVDRSQPSLTLRGLSAPVLVGPVVIVGHDNGRLLALRLEDGQPAWEQTIAVPTGRSELERLADVDATPVLAGTRMVAMSYGGEVVALDVYTGEPRWRRSIRSYSGAVMAGDRLILSDEAGAVWALDMENGAAAWKQEALAWRRLSPPAMHAGFVAVADFEGYVHYLSPSDGRIVGRYRAGKAPVKAPMIERDGRLYVLDAKGRVVALEASRR